MRYETTYEWTVEILDADGDIQEVNFYDNPNDMLTAVVDALADHTHVDFGVVKIIGNDDEGVKERGYAYVRNGQLETTFCNRDTVPKYIHTAMNKAWELHAQR